MSKKLIELEYGRKLGQYRPQFEGKSQNYYELSCSDIISAVSICFSIVILFFFLSVGFYFWSQNISTSNFILVWSIILCIFIPLFMIMAFIGSRNKIQIQSNLIKAALEKQTASRRTIMLNNELGNSYSQIHSNAQLSQ